MGNKITILGLYFVTALLLTPFAVFAQEPSDVSETPAQETKEGETTIDHQELRDAMFNSSGLKLPRFVSLRSDKVFVRTGPALRYPIKWVYQWNNLPVEIIQEFDTWRKIRDHQGEEGWVHQSLTQGERYAMVQNVDKGLDGIKINRTAEAGAKAVAVLENDVIVKLEKCDLSHCKIIVSGYAGWIERKFLYGIYEDEKFD